MTPSINPIPRRRRPSVDAYVAALNARDRKQAERARRERAINRLAHEAEDASRENLWNRVEVTVAIGILAVIELCRLGGL